MKEPFLTLFYKAVLTLVFLILPTACIAYFLLKTTNEFYTLLGDQAFPQTLYFLIGMVISTLLFQSRLRFLPLFLLLFFGFWLGQKGLSNLVVGEFDFFFITVRFQVFAFLFLLGWIVAYVLVRIRYGAIFIAFIVVLASVLVFAHQRTDNLKNFAFQFIPIIVFVFYLIFAAEQLQNKNSASRIGNILLRRLVPFLLFLLLTIGAVIWTFKDQLIATIEQMKSGGKEGSENGMLKKQKDGTFNLKDYAQLKPNLGRSKELLFCAHINNFFEGTEMPNPLYLNAFYFTKFDTTTETFERDAKIPSFDLFEPKVDQIPLYSSQTDSSVILKSKTKLMAKIVEVEIYNRNLNLSTYLAPHTGFYVQPITVERNFRDSFKHAYRTKSYTSELNSAYFVYNSKEPTIQAFQEMRFNILRKAKGYQFEDAQFMSYYTQMPTNEKFNQIKNLAQKLTFNHNTTIDKILALRDYFLSKNASGEPLFKYTDNPGEPDIPSAKKLMYFLFDNHKGYCAYFAGATLFMLRSLGIPSRIAVGFSTVDRSDKNKGWYWYYADQAHAWVQVYFPEYGWLDFDTTIGNTDAEESPKPDGTPPLQPKNPNLIVNGSALHIDTNKKTIQINCNRIAYKDKEFLISPNQPINLDLHMATVFNDSIAIALYQVNKEDTIIGLSFAENLNNRADLKNSIALTIVNKLPILLPIDEVYIKRKINKSKILPIEKDIEKQPFWTFKKFIFLLAGTLLFLILCFLLLPFFMWQYFKIRYGKASLGKSKNFWALQMMHFYLKQLGYFRGNLSNIEYAQVIIDAHFKTQLYKFTQLFNQEKYSSQDLKTIDKEWMSQYPKSFLNQVRSLTPLKQIIKSFLNPFRIFL